MQWKQSTQKVVSDMAGICSNMFWTLRCLHQPCIRSRTSTTTSSDGKVRRPVLNLLKAGNRALESVGFMMQHAPRRPLPTGHHSNDLVPLRHCPPALFPTTTLHYVTSLDHCHLICRAITAGGCVERCANCSPSNHARWDSLYRCRPQHLARHVGDNITD